MLKTSSIKQTKDSKRNEEKFHKRYSSSTTKNFKSIIKYLITNQDNKNHREDNKSISKDLHIDKIESENSI